MKITYDAEADAAYIYLSDEVRVQSTRQADSDINLDFNVENHLVGIEVLSASRLLDMSYLMPFAERLDLEWARLQKELKKSKEGGDFIKTSDDSGEYEIEEIGHNFIRFKNKASGTKKEVTAAQLTSPDPDEALLKSLRKLGKYSSEQGSR